MITFEELQVLRTIFMHISNFQCDSIWVIPKSVQSYHEECAAPKFTLKGLWITYLITIYCDNMPCIMHLKKKHLIMINDLEQKGYLQHTRYSLVEINHFISIYDDT